MISLEGFRPEGEAPIYIQLVWYIKHMAALGAAKNGDELPSRRAVSALLGINPNTVQRAFAVLEEEGLITSRSGSKSHMCLDGESLARIRSELLGGEFSRIVRAMRASGIERERAHELLDRLWEGDEKDCEQK